MNHLFATQDAVDTGTLAVNVTSRAKNTPIADAQITLRYDHRRNDDRLVRSDHPD